jgi:AcrR family transcriptional regulator
MAGVEVTRKRLQQEAVRLFAARGYRHVTVEEIARTAGVSHMTFFRHFPTKASVLLDDPYDPVIGEMVAATDRSMAPVERIRQGLLNSWTGVEGPEDDSIRARLRILTETEDLAAHVWSSNRRTEKVIVEALVSTGVPAFEACVAAGAVMGALTSALLEWGAHDDGDSLGERIGRVLEWFGRDGGADG